MRIRIRTKMSRIRITVYNICILLLILDLLWLNWQVYVDLAVDENGLWAIMAMRENNNTLILKVRYSATVFCDYFC
jgi:hypothetical protein